MTESHWKTVSPVQRRIFAMKTDSCPQQQRQQSATNISRTSTGNASFTAASITRRELPDKFNQQLIGDNNLLLDQSAENILSRSGSVFSWAKIGMPAAERSISPLPGGLIRNFSQRVKSKVEYTLSEPWKEFGERLGATSPVADGEHSQSWQIALQHRQQHRLEKESGTCRIGSVKRAITAANRQQRLDSNTTANGEQNGDTEAPPEPHALVPSTSDDSFDEDPEFQELQEREQIVDKYLIGSDRKFDVDPWENPDFELFKVTDRYGFVHKTSNLTREEEEQRRIQKEVKREKKWLKMLDEWKQRHPAKLPTRIWKGVPNKLRLLIWTRMLGIAEMKANARENLYQELLMRARLVSKDIKQIDLDINRTYRDHLAFRQRYDVKQQSLFNVLVAYAMLNTEVGYCQGMSQIAAIFLLFMDEEDAFWCLHSLLVNRKYTMHGFFVPGFPKLLRFQNHYEKVLLKYLPKVKKHLDKAGIPPIYLTKWWFGCFLDRVPFSLALRIWDVFLYYGDCILIAMAYNIMKMHKNAIIKLTIENFMEFVQSSLSQDFGFSDDRVMDSLDSCLRQLQNDRMALPTPPNPRDPSEVPTKQLGPILTRSMLDIRSEIDEVRSRCSRANSVAGRSPAVRRQNNPPRGSIGVPNASVLRGALNNSRVQQAHHDSANSSRNDQQSSIVSPPVEPFLRRAGSTKDRKQKPPPVPDEDGFVRMSPRQRRALHQQNEEETNGIRHNVVPSASAAVPHKLQSGQNDSANNGPSSSNRSNATANPPPLSNAAIVTTTTQQQRLNSLKSKQIQQQQQQQPRKTPTPIMPSVFANQNSGEHRREVSTESKSSWHRVHRAPNNITVVTLETAEDDDDGLLFERGAKVNQTSHSSAGYFKPQNQSPSPLPYCPPPDYPLYDEPTPPQSKRIWRGQNHEYSFGGLNLRSNGVEHREGILENYDSRRRELESLNNPRMGTTTEMEEPVVKPLYSLNEKTVIRRF